MKKSEIQSRTVMYIIVAVIIILLLLSLIVFLQNLKEKQRRALLEKLRKDLHETVDTIDFGSREEKCHDIPRPASEVCFFDLREIDIILQSPIIDRFPIIKDTLASGSSRNMFVISGDKIEPFDIGDICLDHYPYYSCFDVTDEKLCLFLEGKGRCALILQDLKFCYNPELGSTNNLLNDFILGSSRAKLSFKKNTVLSYPGTEKEICLEPVYFPAQSLISEVYNISPVETGLSPLEGTDISLRFFTELLKSKDDTENIKLKQFDKLSNDWSIVKNAANSLDKNKKTVSDNIGKFSYVAVFGPESPKAVISLRYPGGEKILPSSRGIYVIIQNEFIEFDPTDSYDADKDIKKIEWNLGNGKLYSQDIDTDSKELYPKPVDSYNSPGTYFASLTITDKKGNKGNARVEIRVIPQLSQTGNIKDGTKYQGNPLFLVMDTNDKNNILRLIPLAKWDGYLDDNPGQYDYPLLIYHDQGAPSANVYNLAALKASYSMPSSSPVIVFGQSSAVLNSDSSVQGPPKNFAEDYFSYWTSYSDIVVVEQTSAGLMAALYASSLNAPLLFVPQSISQEDCRRLDGKTIHVVESGKELIQNSCTTIPESKIIPKSIDELRTNTQLNPYSRLYSNFLPAEILS